jgi:acyl-[acyl-carrier-protein] desaturase
VMETRLAMRMYQEYTTFFQKAERERRWNVFDDIPWDKINKNATDELALCAETFCGVEMYLPDYVAGGINVVRKSFGQAWFQANWAYEESKHALALTEYLLRSGKRTDEEMVDFQNRIFEKTWELPFKTPREMTLYGVIQEMATFVIYLKQRDRAGTEKCEALHKIYDFIARDEIAHCRFYQTVVKVLLEEDRDGTLCDLNHVFAKFEMPGVKLVPDYAGRVEVMRSAGIDRAVFLQKVYFPILKYLGITRHELLRAGKKQNDEQGEPTTAIHGHVNGAHDEPQHERAM